MIRVLMVTDAEGSYREAGYRFALTELVKALEEGGCTVTRAHRYEDAPDAQITGFKFDDPAHFNPGDFDEVWLMGFGSSNPAGPYKDRSGYAMSDAEVEVLASFMNDGGGVFATGDHDDLGADLCAKVPRVRSMRRWDADYSWTSTQDLDTLVPDPTKSPPPFGPHRLDTLVSGQDNYYEFQDQSDDVPQRIAPEWQVISSYATGVAGGHFRATQSVPHPLLCGPKGVITVLPDHMHEGRCLVPEALDTTFKIGSQTLDEYPKRSSGVRVSPEVVAWTTVNARKRDLSFQDPESSKDSNTRVNQDDFPVIVAYNGHRVSVGRVVLDSTFHHFVNINVTGVKPEFEYEEDPSAPANAQGFLASPEGQAHYEQIKTYWRNIAHWICRPETLLVIAWDLLKAVALDPRLKQTTPRGTFDRIAPRHLVRFGASAWSLMTERKPFCRVIAVISDIAIADPLSFLLAPWIYIRLTLPDPPAELAIREALHVDKIELFQYALGAAMLELRQPQNRERLQAGRLDAKAGMALVQRSAMAGLHRGLKEQAAHMDRTLTALKQAIELAGR